ncbi:Fungal specific transcription factor domain [Rhizoctonia solani]|uniref:Fungal specific transcription factor domain n=1 Tax=Rhizoctonia solani TaxID=456999 RepID=A0A8H8STP1_9AGAM|nr:Fungal specific transcription factor domain [Rhizoctonia solani]QRW16258.1 Fungal specific transcription factor domain [Rhizoctonia solani]
MTSGREPEGTEEALDDKMNTGFEDLGRFLAGFGRSLPVGGPKEQIGDLTIIEVLSENRSHDKALQGRSYLNRPTTSPAPLEPPYPALDGAISYSVYCIFDTSPIPIPSSRQHGRSHYIINGTAVNKRKADNEPGTNGQVGKKKARTRVSYSCSECHRRKQKCDRQVPCSHCIARRVPELCKNYTPGKGEGDLNLRIARLEQIIEMALPHISASVSISSSGEIVSPQQGQHSFSRSASPSNETDEGIATGTTLDIAAGTLQSGKWYGASALGSVSVVPILEQLQHNGISTGRPPTLDDIQQPTAAEKLKSLVQECGVPPHKLAELVQDLPPKSVADTLVDFYFTHINYTRYPLYEPAFRVSYDSIWTNGVRVSPSDARFLPLLFVVMATAARLAPEHIAGDLRTRRVTSLRYYWSSRRTLTLASAIQNESLELLLARLLSARFLIFDRRITECWSQLGAAVRTAHALGLHRDGAKLGLDPFQTEYRRRIWSYLYHADRTHALLLGRPHSIQDDYTDTLPPMNIEDSELLIATSSPLRPHPLSQPTHMTFVILRHQLAKIIGHIVHHFQFVRSHLRYQEVLNLDNELQQFVAALPPHYSLDPDTSLDTVLDFLPVHRFLIVTEVYFVRISLHRPYLLRKLDSDRFNFSRKACFDSARRDFEARQAFKATTHKTILDSLGGAYREFQAAMISGIALLIEPQSEESFARRRVLDTFINQYGSSSEVDSTTRRELAIIELLQGKQGSPTTEENAKLLLDLNRGGSAVTRGRAGSTASTRPMSTTPGHTLGATTPSSSASPYMHHPSPAIGPFSGPINLATI